jgi:hypothetical protein
VAQVLPGEDRGLAEDVILSGGATAESSCSNAVRNDRCSRPEKMLTL